MQEEIKPTPEDLARDRIFSDYAYDNQDLLLQDEQILISEAENIAQSMGHFAEICEQIKVQVDSKLNGRPSY